MSFLSKASGLDFAKSMWNDFTGQTAVNQQNAYNMKMWQMQQDYNTPANQMKRYREAGLNPNLVYGGSGQMAGNATSAPEMTAHQGSAAKALGLVETLVSLKGALQGQELEKLKTTADIAHQADVLDLSKKKILLDSIFRQDELGFRKESWKKDYDLRKSAQDFAEKKFGMQWQEILNWGANPGSTTYFLSKLIGQAMGKSPFDVAGDVNSGLNQAIGWLLGADKPVTYKSKLSPKVGFQSHVKYARRNPADSIGFFRLFSDL